MNAWDKQQEVSQVSILKAICISHMNYDVIQKQRVNRETVISQQCQHALLISLHPKFQVFNLKLAKNLAYQFTPWYIDCLH